MKRIAGILLALAFGALTLSSPASASADASHGGPAVEAANACGTWGCYLAGTSFAGFYHVPGATPLCSASAVGAGTVSCGYNQSYTVTAGASANIDITLIKDQLAANFGLNGSLAKTITITNGCSHNFGAAGGRLWGVPEYSKSTYSIHRRDLGGGSGNDPRIGDGWIGVPNGMKCYFVTN
ncbi:hypothetical protein ACFWNN_02655 [Lentzea sp. NPDC058450]|uniref:hypothetical protein n=1 Tax=Lentzea sp. NPDC058450 TaxID=3346505 RepID=UPI00365052C8